MLTHSQRACLAGAIWVAGGLSLTIRGLLFWGPTQDVAPGWAVPALLLGAVIGAAKGFFVLRKSAVRMIRRIENGPALAPFWQMYPPYFYPIILVMIGMGVALRMIYGGSHPSLILAIYVGIGIALLTSALPYFAAARRLAAAAPRAV